MLTDGAKTDKTVDWWALGCILYELLIGIPPFFAKDKVHLLYKIKNSEVAFPKKSS